MVKLITFFGVIFLVEIFFGVGCFFALLVGANHIGFAFGPATSDAVIAGVFKSTFGIYAVFGTHGVKIANGQIRVWV